MTEFHGYMPPFPPPQSYPWQTDDQDIYVYSNIGLGVEGPRGHTGPIGNTGPQGPIGETGPRGHTGPQGAPLTWNDLTQAQINALRKNITGFTIRKYTFEYSDFTVYPTIASAEFSPAFASGRWVDVADNYIELVFKNGLYIEGPDEYYISVDADDYGVVEHLYFTLDTTVGNALPVSGDVYNVVVISLKESQATDPIIVTA